MSSESLTTEAGNYHEATFKIVVDSDRWYLHVAGVWMGKGAVSSILRRENIIPLSR